MPTLSSQLEIGNIPNVLIVIDVFLQGKGLYRVFQDVKSISHFMYVSACALEQVCSDVELLVD